MEGGNLDLAHKTKGNKCQAVIVGISSPRDHFSS